MTVIAADPNVYVPMMGRIVETRAMTGTDRYYKVALPRPLGHRPGQFVMLSVLGVGEAAISISNGPTSEPVLEMVIRRVGSLTGVFHKLQVNDAVGVRGPFGNGFDLEWFAGRDGLLVCGGLGLVPLRSLIQPLVEDQSRFGRLTLVTGCRSPAEELYREDVRLWQEAPGVSVVRLVDDTKHMPWDGQVGLVTAPIPRLDLDVPRTVAALCGPPVMYKFVVMALMARGFASADIFVDLERRMRCGVGKCGHCQINEVTCCMDGPVFRLSALDHLPEAFQ